MSLPPENAAELEQTLEATPPPRSRLKLDLVTSYLVTAARVGSNVAIFAILYRYTNERYAATYVVIRSVFMLLTYVFGGLNPTLQRMMSTPLADLSKHAACRPTVLGQPQIRDDARVAQAHANLIASLLVLLLAVPVTFYGLAFNQFHSNPLTRPWHAGDFAGWFALGMLFRLWSEPSSAVLQIRGRLSIDNLIQIAGEVLWVGVCLWAAVQHNPASEYGSVFRSMGVAFFLVSTALMVTRRFFAALTLGLDVEPWRGVSTQVIVPIARSASMIAIGQFADFLYAPANILLINTFVHPSAVARYAPALQIDAGLLLLVSAVSTVMLPRAMSAWARGERKLLRSAYLRATLACLIVLAGAALCVGIFIEPILRLWLGTVPADTPTLTRLVLVHTVIGGTAGVGRAVLLGMGRFKAYTLSALLGGIANVSLALLFVLVLDLGLIGIVLATVISVTARCAIWMPLYILRTLRAESATRSH